MLTPTLTPTFTRTPTVTPTATPYGGGYGFTGYQGRADGGYGGDAAPFGLLFMVLLLVLFLDKK